MRVRSAPAWDTSAQDALGEVREYSEANALGTGWEVEVWLDVDGESSLWYLDEECLEAVEPILPIWPAEDQCIAPDGATQDEAYAQVVLRKGADPIAALATTREALGVVFGGDCKYGKIEGRSDTLTDLLFLWCNAVPLVEIMNRLHRASAGEWCVVDDGWRVYLDFTDERAGTFLGEHALTLHVDLLPWSSPRRRTERYGPEPGTHT